MSRETLFEVLIRLQQSVPFMLPNEYLAWRKYNSKFSNMCDCCNNQEGEYNITYQDPKRPLTIIRPIGVRLCVGCLAEADNKVGVIDGGGEEETLEINRV